MYSLELLLAFGLAMLLIGLIGGFLIAQKSANSPQAQRKLEKHLDDLERKQQDYQHEVTEHFVETAELLNQLTDSYRDVHNHLAKGAQKLAGENAQQSLKMIAADDANDNEEIDDIQPITPPLDYAPKSSNNEPGMLNEEFGIQKNGTEEAEIPASASNK